MKRILPAGTSLRLSRIAHSTSAACTTVSVPLLSSACSVEEGVPYPWFALLPAGAVSSGIAIPGIESPDMELTWLLAVGAAACFADCAELLAAAVPPQPAKQSTASIANMATMPIKTARGISFREMLPGVMACFITFTSVHSFAKALMIQHRLS
jgi:hypothetical protein